MSRKKIEVVELNKKEEKILLEEKTSPLILFWRKNRLLIFLTLLILSLTVLILGILLNIKNFDKTGDSPIKEVAIETSLEDYIANIPGNKSMTEEYAKKLFAKNNALRGKGEVLLIDSVETNNMIIKFYSDGTAIKILKNGKSIIRIAPLKNGEYGINKKGTINSKAITSIVTIISTKKYPWGEVTYYSDGTAIVNNSKMDIFVRDATDVKNNYISDNKVAYLKETKQVGNIKLNYYYDGTIEIIKNGKTYLVRTANDLNITTNDVTFKNNNEATIINTKKMKNGYTIDYFSDGGAIIRDGKNNLSVRKSNSIIIKDDKIFEIVDNIYVEISKQTNNVIYYTNGAAVVNYSGKTYYVDENSNIKYNNNGNITTIENNKEELSKETNLYNENVKMFDGTAVITTKDYIAIIPADKVVYDELGKIKDLNPDKQSEDEEDIGSFKITNNTNEKIKYRVVIEQSERTDLDIEYIRYIVSTDKSTSSPSKLNKAIWEDDKLKTSLGIKGPTYILVDSTLEPLSDENISLMLWTDYETIPNSMQDKYFYGTIKVYAWTEE